jgi:hypothetical protein
VPLAAWDAYPEYARIAIYDAIVAVVKAENPKASDDGEEPDTDLLAGALRRSARRGRREEALAHGRPTRADAHAQGEGSRLAGPPTGGECQHPARDGGPQRQVDRRAVALAARRCARDAQRVAPPRAAMPRPSSRVALSDEKSINRTASKMTRFRASEYLQPSSARTASGTPTSATTCVARTASRPSSVAPSAATHSPAVAVGCQPQAGGCRAPAARWPPRLPKPTSTRGAGLSGAGRSLVGTHDRLRRRRGGLPGAAPVRAAHVLASPASCSRPTAAWSRRRRRSACSWGIRGPPRRWSTSCAATPSSPRRPPTR